jgi:7-cyano-7-deazaguanine synthase
LTSTVAVLFSGGLDSSILLGHLVQLGHTVQPLYVDSQLVWQPAELQHSRRFLEAMPSPALRPLVVLSLPLADLYDGHWSVTGQDVPASDAPDETVYLPGRNPLLLIKAQIWCQLHGVAQLALGALASNPFADASDRFFVEFEAAIDRAISGHVELLRPLAEFDKRQVMELGRELPLALTFSCLAPLGGLHCGRCNKCAERRKAFADAGMSDESRYVSRELNTSVANPAPCADARSSAAVECNQGG